MPKAELPTTFKGFVVALAASFAGLMAGFVTIKILRKWL